MKTSKQFIWTALWTALFKG